MFGGTNVLGGQDLQQLRGNLRTVAQAPASEPMLSTLEEVNEFDLSSNSENSMSGASVLEDPPEPLPTVPAKKDQKSIDQILEEMRKGSMDDILMEDI